MAECLALTDLDAIINIMPLSVWNKLTLPELTPTLMTLELADRSFLKTERSLIDVLEGELTLLVEKEAITFNLDQTSRYLANYNDTTANQIDVIDMACEEYSQEVLGFSDVIVSGNPTPYYDPLVSTTSPTLLKICEAKTGKSSIDEPPDVKLKDLPPHLEYVFLEGDDKLPVVIAKDLSVEEKTALITVLKSHKRVITYKLSDIKKDSKARLLCWVLLLKEFTFKVIDTKGAENLAADHLSRLENPHQNVLDPKEINESFPLETLNMVSSRGNSSTPWTTPFCLKSVRIKSSEGVYTARKPLTFSRLATMDPPGDIMARMTLPRRCLTPDSIGPLSTEMPKT
nr:reverse transcriptase domain-containing protein [Tanacetum cinerariifolium]